VENAKEHTASKGYSVFLLGIISAVIAMPIFILIYKFLPVIEIPLGENSIRLDHIIFFLLLFFSIYYLVKVFRIFIYIILIGGLLVLTITNFSGTYTLEHLYHDYAELLYSLSDHTTLQNFDRKKGEFSKEELLREAINFKDPILRNFAASIAIKNFSEQNHLAHNRKWVQFFSVFKEVYGKWNYVYDPIEDDYYASATETMQQLYDDNLFKGDCDDYSIMMAACIKAIGGEVRVVRTVLEQNGKRVGHMYPEVKFGDEKDLETVVYLIKNVFFVEESMNKPVFYYRDNKGFIWLNFDYTDQYPGGKYMSEVRESEIII
jgi:hypothetical protein